MKRYRDYATKEKGDMEQRALMDKIQALSFAVLETSLFLDSRPHHRMALAYYAKVKNELDAAMGEYEMKYAPLSQMGYGGTEQTGWQWVKQPWPWEVNFPTTGDNPQDIPEQNTQKRCRGREE